ncbi:MAG: AraC family transcriptional regulator, partial [Opitutaceae bacterium]|nr:AraC family transcriptional regulator [Opitutaceae bacterium]
APETTPETTSAETMLGDYAGGKCLSAGAGAAWRELQAALFAQGAVDGRCSVPAVSEPVLHWMVSGEIESWERERGRAWVKNKNRIRRGGFFLTVGGAPYECRWRRTAPEPFEFMVAVVGLPLMRRALEEVFGREGASRAVLREQSGFEDAALAALMGQLREELVRRAASPLRVEGLARLVAVHLARHYASPPRKISPAKKDARRVAGAGGGDAAGGGGGAGPAGIADAGAGAATALPGWKLRRVTDWMAEHRAEPFHLDELAAQAGLSKYHFHRLFKNATGVTPLRHHTGLRMDAARRLLRETRKSILEIALETGYANPSHFTQRFRRETGLNPADYRRPR